MKLKEKTKAIHLRKLGKSYSEIGKKISVSKSTLSLWLRDIDLTDIQLKRLKGRQKSGLSGGKANHEKRIQKTKKIIEESRKEAKNLLKKPLFLLGLMLYWAEGDKSEERERVKFSNSDPLMIKLMIKWFRDICKIPEKKLKIALHIRDR